MLDDSKRQASRRLIAASNLNLRSLICRFGLALAQWLSQKGAKALLLTSKRGLRTGAQAKIIEQLRSQGTQV